MTNEELAETIEDLCESKADEFRMLGYEHATGWEIWDCVSERYQKSGQPAIHQIVNDILSLKVTAFMNFLTLSAFKGTRFHE